jgi:hypothetical protein
VGKNWVPRSGSGWRKPFYYKHLLVYCTTDIGYIGGMTDKPILNFAIDPALLARLDDFRYRRRFPTRAAAAKFLLDHALNQDPDPKPVPANPKKGA